MEPIELITAPFDVYVAPVGESFPAINAAPAGNWVKLGTSGNRDYNDAGVTLTHNQTINFIRTYGSTGPRKAVRTEEALLVAFNLMNLKPLYYDYALSKAGVTDTAEGAGTAGHKAIYLYRGLTVYEIALLVRGEAASAELEDTQAQFEIPRVIQSGSPTPSFTKGDAAFLALEFAALEDENASSAAERFGVYRVMDAQPT